MFKFETVDLSLPGGYRRPGLPGTAATRGDSPLGTGAAAGAEYCCRRNPVGHIVQPHGERTGELSVCRSTPGRRDVQRRWREADDARDVPV